MSTSLKITEDGKVIRLTEVEVSSTDLGKITTRVLGGSRQEVKFDLDFLMQPDAKDACLFGSVTEGQLYVTVVTQIKEVDLHTYYGPIIPEDAKDPSEVVMVPVYAPRPLSVLSTARYKFVDGLRVFAAIQFTKSSEGGNVVESTGHMFALVEGSDRLYLPPLPNVYDDGRICWGNEVEPLRQRNGWRTFSEASNSIHEQLDNTVWNADLMRDATYIYANNCLRATPTDLNPIEPSEELAKRGRDCLALVGNRYLNEIADRVRGGGTSA